MTFALSFVSRSDIVNAARNRTNVFWNPKVDSSTPLEGVPNLFTRRAGGIRESWVSPPTYRMSFVIKKLRPRIAGDVEDAPDLLEVAQEFTDSIYLYGEAVAINAELDPRVRRTFLAYGFGQPKQIVVSHLYTTLEFEVETDGKRYI